MLGIPKKMVIGLGKMLAALVLFSAIFAAYGFYRERSAKEKSAAICASIPPDSDPSSLRDAAIADGASDFQTRWFRSGGFDILSITYVGVPPFSRHICRVKAEGRRVISVEQGYLD